MANLFEQALQSEINDTNYLSIRACTVAFETDMWAASRHYTRARYEATGSAEDKTDYLRAISEHEKSLARYHALTTERCEL